LNYRMQRRPLLALAVALSALLAACNAGTSASPSATAATSVAGSPAPSVNPVDLTKVPPKPDYAGAITADGATVPQPVYEQWAQDYAAQTGIQISYTGGGPGQGVKDFIANVVQFAGSDAPLKDTEKADAESKNGSPAIHIPTVFGAIVMAYNLGGISKPINFSPDVIGRIFTGQIKNWNDAAIAADNTGLNFPDLAITVAHRSDGSGTTNAFTTYLCKVSTDWAAKVNPCSGKEVSWPVGLGGKGNAGVTSTITTTPGAVGYIELSYAIQNNVPFGNVKNSSVADGYPITAATWILMYQQQDKVNPDEKQADAVVHFLLWALLSGGNDANTLGYATLPDALKAAALNRIATITYKGVPIVNALYK
jgi:phosphate transport system substrate-binding protein